MNLSFERKVALVTGAAGASATIAMTHIAIQEALNAWGQRASTPKRRARSPELYSARFLRLAVRRDWRAL